MFRYLGLIIVFILGAFVSSSRAVPSSLQTTEATQTAIIQDGQSTQNVPLSASQTVASTLAPIEPTLTPNMTLTAITQRVYATQTAFAQTPTPPTQDCIAIVGDSIAYGIGVFEVPGHGFPVVRTTPLAEQMQTFLTEQNSSISVVDRSVTASFLTTPESLAPIQVVYYETETFQQLLADQCRWTILTPWYNDLLVLERDDPAQAHVDEVINFVDQLHAANPGGWVLVLHYYYGDPSAFTQGADVALQPENITAFNDALTDACAETGVLAALEQVYCMETQPIFDPLTDNAHLILRYGSNLFSKLDIIGIESGSRAMFDFYFRDNPNGTIRGDGIHLTPLGKRLLIDAVWAAIVDYDAVWAMP